MQFSVMHSFQAFIAFVLFGEIKVLNVLKFLLMSFISARVGMKAVRGQLGE